MPTEKQLDKLQTLGDGTLSPEEIAILKSKEKLVGGEITNALIKDISMKNKEYMSINQTENQKKTKKIMDYLTTHRETIKGLDKNNPQIKQIFAAKDEFAKQCVIINVLLSNASIQTEVAINTNTHLLSAKDTSLTNHNPIPEELMNFKVGEATVSNIPGAGVLNVETLNQSYDIGKFTQQTVMLLHTFQKKYENIAGFSKADCIIGSETIQQLLHDTGNSAIYDTITGTAGVVIDNKYGVANVYTTKEITNIPIMHSTFDALINDTRVNADDKLTTLITLYKKGANLDTKETANLFITYARTLRFSMSAMEWALISPQIDGNLQDQLEKAGGDLEQLKADVMNEEERSYEQKANLALAVAIGRRNYLSTKKIGENPQKISQINKAIVTLQGLQQYKGRDTSQQIAEILKEALIPTKEDGTKKALLNNNLRSDYTYHQQKAVLDFIASIFSAKNGEEITYRYELPGGSIPTSSLSGTTSYASSVVKDTFTVDWNNYPSIVEKITEIIRTFDMSFDGDLKYSSDEAISSTMKAKEETDPTTFRFNVGHTQELTYEERQVYGKYNGDMDRLDKLLKNPDKMQELMDALSKHISLTTTEGGATTQYKVTNEYADKEAIQGVFKDVGWGEIPRKIQNQLREKYRETKNQVEEKTKQGVNEGIGAIITSLQQALEFHKKQGNTSEVDTLQPQIEARKKFQSGQGPLPDVSNNPQLQQTLQTMGFASNETSITKEQFIQKCTTAILQPSMTPIVQGVMFDYLAEKNGKAFDILKKKNKSSQEQMVSLYSNIKGYGKALSDQTFNTIIDVSKELAIGLICTMVPMAAITYLKSATTIINLIDKANKISTGIKWIKLGNIAAFVGEVGIFHVMSTTMSNLMHGNNAFETLGDRKGYVHTALFLGAFKAIHGPLQAMAKKAGEYSIAGKGLTITQASLNFLKSRGLKIASLGTEMGGMVAIEQAIGHGFNLFFGDEIPPLSAESIAQTVGFVIGMRLLGRFMPKPKPGTREQLDVNAIIKKIRKDKIGNIEKVVVEVNGKEMSLTRTELEKLTPQQSIDRQHNNYKKSPEQQKLDNKLKREEKQNKFELQLLQAQEAMNRVPEHLITEHMKVLRDAGDISTLSPNDIKRVQREIGTKPDGVWGDQSLNKLENYFDSKLSGNNNHIKISESGVKSEKANDDYRKGVADMRSQTASGIEGINTFLKKGNIITIDGVKHQYIGIENGEAQFAPQSGKGEKVAVKSLAELADTRFNLEPGNKATNSGRKEKLDKLLAEQKAMEQEVEYKGLKMNTIKFSKDKLTQKFIEGSEKIKDIQEKLKDRKLLTKEESEFLELIIGEQSKQLEMIARDNHEVCKNIMKEVGIIGRAIDIIENCPLKQANRIKDKVIKECDGHIEQITDIVRGTLVFNTVKDMQNALSILSNNSHVKSFKCKDRLTNEENFYKNCRDMLINVELENGFVFEVQFHLPEVLRLKDPGLFDSKCPNAKRQLQWDNRLSSEIYNFKKLGNERTGVDQDILRYLNKHKGRGKKFLVEGDEIVSHDLYDISRELPPREEALNSGKYDWLTNEGVEWKDINTLKNKIDVIQNAINEYAISKYNERTGDNYIPNQYVSTLPKK